MGMKQLVGLSLLTAAILLMSGCGEDRSTLYDANGQRIGGFGKKSAWIYQTPAGKRMIARNYVYIPGGFDVDGDGIDESGFWLARYEARETNQSVPDFMGSVKDVIRNNFLIFNPDANPKRFDRQLDFNDTRYVDVPLRTLEGFHVAKVRFTDEGNATGSYSPLEAVVAMEYSQVEDTPWHLSIPTEKQWMQVVKLVINNKENWTEGEVGKGRLYQGKTFTGTDRRYFVIANDLLGHDPHVPSDYTTTVYDLSGNLAEWTRGMFAKEDRFLGGDQGFNDYTTLGAEVPRWWLPIVTGATLPLHHVYGAGMYYDGSNRSGATDTLAITGKTGDVDPYAVVARGGSATEGDDALVGVSAAKLSYGPGFKDPSIGFRGASEYIEE